MGELVAEVGGKHIGAGGGPLAPLDEGRPRHLQRFPALSHTHPRSGPWTSPVPAFWLWHSPVVKPMNSQSFCVVVLFSTSKNSLMYRLVRSPLSSQALPNSSGMQKSKLSSCATHL